MLPPLAFVVLLSMIKDAYEDYKRHQEDKGENNATTEVYSKQAEDFVQAAWKDIKVGDVVRVRENCFFPADVVVLSSSEEQGVFYVETKNLDGETNLKLKHVAKAMLEPFSNKESLKQLAGVFNVEEPNNRIYKFDGNFEPPNLDSAALESKGLVPLSNENVALRGMSLRNTESVTGVVVYTGHDSKIQMNSAGATYKTSNISRQTNKQIILVFIIQIVASMLGAIVGASWMVANLDSANYLSFNKNDPWNSNWFLLFIKTTGTWILIFTNFVPISLIVTLEIVKFWQGSFMGFDASMFDAE